VTRKCRLPEEENSAPKNMSVEENGRSNESTILMLYLGGEAIYNFFHYLQQFEEARCIFAVEEFSDGDPMKSFWVQAVSKGLYAVTPMPVVNFMRRLKRANEFRENRSMTTEEVFTDVYLRGRWGGAEGEFSSGHGSHDDAIVRKYVAALRPWLESINSRELTCVDLGCGDFNVGKQLADLCGKYVGVDIVQPVIEHHQANFSNDRVTFKRLNIVEDQLPSGDVCFLRQVLQHLSNRQIAAVLAKLGQYKWAVITEH
jgi:hypothetical protein